MSLAIAVIVIAVAVLVAARLGTFSGRAPDNLGVREGKLKPPSRTDNSISSQADLWPGAPASARIAPIAPQGDAKATIAKIAQVVETLPGAEIVERRDDYLYARFTTALMRFTDDTEFWFDPAANVVQVRSASRVGRKDFGVNRARVENIRARLGS